jgi:glucose-1-phosphate cytidylyltransferase
MTVTVKIPAQLRGVTAGEGEIEVEGSTVGEALDAVYDQHAELRQRITEDGGLRRFVNVYVSGEDIRFKDGLDTALDEGDEVTILPAVAGGSAPAPADLPVAILCGGRGTRLQEKTHEIPKALVEIGGKPIVWHVIRVYAAQGFRRFLLLTGYKGEMIEGFVADEAWPEPVEVECVHTGLDTPTGGRVALAADRLSAGPFCLTYADGVADIDLGALLEFHADQEAVATMTVVRPYSQWGIAVIDEKEHITGFREKPRLDYWINGGFLCAEPAFLDYLEETSVLEQEPLEGVAADGKLAAFRHDGFWDCMDTYKDAVVLNDLWEAGEAPWRVWERPLAPQASGTT